MCNLLANIKEMINFCKYFCDFACKLIIIMYFCTQIKHKLKKWHK
jgi:hypothetical protein